MKYLIVLISSLSFSFFDLSRKKLIQTVPTIPLLFWVMFFQTFLFVALTLLSLNILPEESAIALWFELFRQEFWSQSGFLGKIEVFLENLRWSDYLPPYLLGTSFLFLGNISFLESLKRCSFSLAIPLLSFISVFSGIVGYFFLGEMLSIVQWSALGVVVCSGFLLYFSEENRTSSRLWGALLMVFSAFFLAMVPVFDKIALSMAPSELHGIFQSFGIWLFLLFYILLTNQKVFLKSLFLSQKPMLILAILSSTMAIFFQFWAIQLMFVGVFEGLKRAICVVATIILGRLFFQEKLLLKKMIAVALLLGGILMLSV